MTLSKEQRRQRDAEAAERRARTAERRRIGGLIAAAKAAGATRYFTGHPCLDGHVAERYVVSRRCVVCVEEGKVAEQQHRYTAKWASANRDRINERQRRRYAEAKAKKDAGQ